LRRLFESRWAAGGWGIAFVVLLFVSAALVSLPTTAESGERIVTFYSAHAQVIVVQQMIGVLALGAFISFALSLKPGRALHLALWLFAATELLTNAVPVVIVASNPSADTAHSLTVVEDWADGAFFLAAAAFVAAVTLLAPTWLRMVGYVVALACVIRAIASPLGFTALDDIAPFIFVAFILLLSVRSLVRPQSPVAVQPAS
jgi:hypothetical protein